MFGWSESQIASFGMTFGLTAFISYMMFIVWRLCRDSNAGKLGSVILFLVLGLGVLGFVSKNIIQKLLNI